MKKSMITYVLAACFSSAALAQPADIVGGADGSTQTIHHCGFLPTSATRYTTSPTTIRIIEAKLSGLGYFRGRVDGVFGKAEQRAVRQFQSAYGLKADGVVGPVTAQRLAYVTNPSPNVRRCFRLADAGSR